MTKKKLAKLKKSEPIINNISINVGGCNCDSNQSNSRTNTKGFESIIKILATLSIAVYHIFDNLFKF